MQYARRLTHNISFFRNKHYNLSVQRLLSSNFSGLLETETILDDFYKELNHRSEIDFRRRSTNALLFARTLENDGKHKIGSSVLVLFVSLPHEDSTEPWVLFTRRSFKLRSHPGEISFPGGKLNDGETADQAALRESHEEIALDKNKVELWGCLRPIFTTTTTKSTLLANVGVLRDVGHLNTLQPSNDEVETIFVAPVSELVTSVAYTNFRYLRNNKTINFTLPVFSTQQYQVLSTTQCVYKNVIGKYRIWGLTALVLHETLCSLLGRERIMATHLSTGFMTRESKLYMYIY